MLLANADNNIETEIALTLMSRAGLRRQEVVDVTFNHLLETETGATCRIWEGKRDKYREVPVPDDLLTRTETMLQMDDREPDDAIVTVAASTLYSWTQRAAERSHAETGDAGWLEVGPHDLRRSWGVRLLTREAQTPAPEGSLCACSHTPILNRQQRRAAPFQLVLSFLHGYRVSSTIRAAGSVS